MRCVKRFDFMYINTFLWSFTVVVFYRYTRSFRRCEIFFCGGGEEKDASLKQEICLESVHH